MNSIRKGFKPQLTRDKEGNIVSNKEKVLQRWSECYEMHFELQDRMDSDSGEEWTMCVQTAEIYVKPPNDVDIEMVISKLKNGKVTVHNRIAAELIKEGVKELKKVIHELTSKIWEEEVIPQEWNYGIICPIHKKGVGGGVMMCEKYRAATLLCTTYRILAGIIYVKLVPYAEEIIGEYQGGI